MVPRQDFGKIGGVVKLHYALPFPRCIVWQALKGLGLWTFGWFRGPGEDGTSALEGTFMIRNWRRCKVSLAPLILRVSILISVIVFGGKRQKMVALCKNLFRHVGRRKTVVGSYKDAVEPYRSH